MQATRASSTSGTHVESWMLGDPSELPACPPRDRSAATTEARLGTQIQLLIYCISCLSSQLNCQFSKNRALCHLSCSQIYIQGTEQHGESPFSCPRDAGWSHGGTYFLLSVKGSGRGGGSSALFHPVECLLCAGCLEKKDLGTEVESWKGLH